MKKIIIASAIILAGLGASAQVAPANLHGAAGVNTTTPAVNTPTNTPAVNKKAVDTKSTATAKAKATKTTAKTDEKKTKTDTKAKVKKDAPKQPVHRGAIHKHPVQKPATPAKPATPTTPAPAKKELPQNH